MFAYIFLNFFIIFLGLIHSGGVSKNKKASKLVLIYTSILILAVISGLRGDFATDYKNYKELFNSYNQYSYIDLWDLNLPQEIGYVYFGKIIGHFTDNFIYVAIISSLIIITLTIKCLERESKHIWLGILIFINIGYYYVSFNLIRQIIAASILFYSSIYIEERKPIKFFLACLAATLLHKTSIFIFPFYYLLNLNLNAKNAFIIISILFSLYIYLDDLIILSQTYFFTAYDNDSYGMTGYSINNAIIPIFVMLFTIMHANKADLQNKKTSIWINAIIFYAFFSALGLKIQMLERFSHFFSPYAALIIPHIIYEIKNKNIKLIYISAATIMLILFNYITISNSAYNPYYFAWNK